MARRELPLGCEVTEADLEHIERFLVLLRALDDPLVSRDILARRVSDIPVLVARCLARASNPTRKVKRLAEALSILGNFGLERILFELLEELTVLKSDVSARNESAAQ
jgi:hypothetical protein